MLNSNQKLELLEIQSKLSNLFNELGNVLVTNDDDDLDDIMQRVEQMKLEMDDLLDDYNIKEDQFFIFNTNNVKWLCIYGCERNCKGYNNCC